ncbi:MAG: hypothetical protein IKC11_02880 [Clostridia bacterium]|nr:hypothetical protein [Clostridia bacterium]
MTRILANNQHGQRIFESYNEVKEFFEISYGQIRNAENSGLPLRHLNTGELFWIDKLFSEEDLGKCEK